MQTNATLSASDIIRNVRHRQDCFKVSIDLFNFLKSSGMDAFVAWNNGHVWVVMNILGAMMPLETQLLGVPSLFFDYSKPDVMTNNRDVIEKEYLLNLSIP